MNCVNGTGGVQNKSLLEEVQVEYSGCSRENLHKYHRIIRIKNKVWIFVNIRLLNVLKIFIYF